MSTGWKVAARCREAEWELQSVCATLVKVVQVLFIKTRLGWVLGI